MHQSGIQSNQIRKKIEWITKWTKNREKKMFDKWTNGPPRPSPHTHTSLVVVDDNNNNLFITAKCSFFSFHFLEPRKNLQKKPSEKKRNQFWPTTTTTTTIKPELEKKNWEEWLMRCSWKKVDFFCFFLLHLIRMSINHVNWNSGRFTEIDEIGFSFIHLPSS